VSNIPDTSYLRRPTLFFYLSFFHSYLRPRYLHSFPTRRSSDLCRQVLIEAWILRQVADAPADGGAIANDVLPENGGGPRRWPGRSEEHTSELQSHLNLVCRLLLEKKKRSNSNLTVLSRDYRQQI